MKVNGKKYELMHCCGLTEVWAKPHTATHSFPQSRMRERIRRVKVRKLVGWDNDSLISKKERRKRKKQQQQKKQERKWK